ncbi:MAG: substrate-binding periplasmic protein [Bdellovibrionales bacterium]
MKKLLGLTVLVLIALAAGYIGSGLRDVKPDAGTETAFERIMRTKTLRCGYAVIGLGVIKDPNTGTLSGTVHDIVEEAGKALGLKIEWAEEMPFGGAIEGLKAARYDVICAPLYARPNMMPHAEMSEPYYAVPVNAYVRTGDKRFTSRDIVNQPEIKISYQDGTIPAFVKQNDFPQAGGLTLPDMDYSDILMGVSSGKADITFVEPAVAEGFMANNPGTLEVATAISPLYVFPVVLAVNKGEYSLNTMLSWTIRYMRANGQLDAIIRKYEKYPGMFMPITQEYVK